MRSYMYRLASACVIEQQYCASGRSSCQLSCFKVGWSDSMWFRHVVLLLSGLCSCRALVELWVSKWGACGALCTAASSEGSEAKNSSRAQSREAARQLGSQHIGRQGSQT